MLALSDRSPWRPVLRQSGLAMVVLGVVAAHAGLWWSWMARSGAGDPGRASQAASTVSGSRSQGLSVRSVRILRPALTGGADVTPHAVTPLAVPRAASPEPGSASPSPAPSSEFGSPVPREAPPEALRPIEGPPGWLADYLEADDLDEPPRPLSGWVLDESALQQRYRARLTVAVWVSAEGVIVHVRPLAAEPNGPWALQAIAPLAATAMQPGYRHGEPRPARVVIEITSDDETVR
ncbi:hypothetical protein [uncultured Aquabacterium sp.]|uniref:hypothetical protein n=1 Tax=Aquabacterium sp. TaxID=1872578 RepID=UPI0025EAA745|nr:hypothetical protein [uncultured Aquabacterium sp.]